MSSDNNNGDSALQQQQQTISLEELPLSQLQNIKNQLETEISGLTEAFTQMKQAQGAFRECKNCIEMLTPESQDKTIMVPLSNSLYVPGKISNIDSVVVDVGTGYYVEKSTADGLSYYDGKIEYVQGNLKKIQETMEQKQSSYRGLMEVMQFKISQQHQQQQQASTKQTA
ncbi:prefoldin subunit 5 [Coemansia reversa NRRL 1564]|uniref:Prefoldin subunit 5 n=1 Tax=Coemansia reversa (strain ATCC 12441 / NRRL 1564) TaxID=763665 RepID=A0A2G5BFV1_COERN|nr:prefoldin subunit 5 [Coemansia reversa NRRL 1564]|eukprot:PIA17880.1 prefoldin subunit 5 [Coemansia reversa NRRL 1564]